MMANWGNIDDWHDIDNMLKGFFKGDSVKARLWLESKNPLLGDISPLEMIYVGRIDKLLEFMRESLNEDMQDRL